MKKFVLYLSALIIAVISTVACSEDDLQPTVEPEFGYHVPQGNHEYDDKIVSWNERSNVFILYKFLPRDIYWSVTGWLEATPRESEFAGLTWNPGIIGLEADTNYVGKQLELLENNFLNYYPDTLLKRCLPLKILLCSNLFDVRNDGTHIFKNVINGYDYFAVNWGRDTILRMTIEGENLFRKELNYMFLERTFNNQKMRADADFYLGMNYTDKITNQNMYSRGFIKSTTKEKTDWLNYVEAVISTPYEDLIAETSGKDYTFKGILNPIKDTQGFIRKKYDILVSWYKEMYGINLQDIGNSNK